MDYLTKFLILSVCLSASNAQSRQQWLAQGQQTLTEAVNRRNNEGIANNVILFLGDGMGVSTITAARIFKGQLDGGTGEEYRLTMEKLPYSGIIKTYNTNQQVPDSAGTATAFLSGVKARAGVLGVDESVVKGDCTNLKDGALETIVDWALQEGKSVGLVSTARITHATPGAAYAKIPHRDWECDSDIRNAVNCDSSLQDIALQLVENHDQIQVILGGGRQKFYPTTSLDSAYPTQFGQRRDGRDLVEEWKAKQAQQGRNYQYVWNNDQFKQVNTTNVDYLFGLFNPSHMAWDSQRQETGSTSEPSISDMTATAINILSKNDKGFFLLVEGGKIDHGHHGNSAFMAVTETVAMDAAIDTALNMTSEADTLVMVTADHSHVFAIAGYPARGNPILGLNPSVNPNDGMPMTTLIYGNGPGPGRIDLTNVDTTAPNFLFPNAVPLGSETHGGEDVAVFAKGPMSHLVTGCNEQNLLPLIMGYAACIGPDKSHCNTVIVG